MGNEEMRNMVEMAVNTLETVSVNELETVEINQTKYDDGSVGWSVNLTFTAKETDEFTSSEGIVQV